MDENRKTEKELEQNYHLYDSFLSYCVVECSKRWKDAPAPIIIENIGTDIYSLVCYKAISIYCTCFSKEMRIKTSFLNRMKLRRLGFKFQRYTKKDKDGTFFDPMKDKTLFDNPLTVVQKDQSLLKEIYDAYYSNLL